MTGTRLLSKGFHGTHEWRTRTDLRRAAGFFGYALLTWLVLPPDDLVAVAFPFFLRSLFAEVSQPLQ